MNSLKYSERQYFEQILGMSGGYVLDFTDAKFGDFFNGYESDIHNTKYQCIGTSKANKLRAFLQIEPDPLVGSVLAGLLDVYEANCDVSDREPQSALLTKTRDIVARLSGDSPTTQNPSVEVFLKQAIEIPNLHKLLVEFAVADLINQRMEEVRKGLSVGAHLSVIVMCGSVLEAILLGAAHKEPEKFNRSQASPKRDGKVKPFHDWLLTEFINVATEIDILDPDVREFSHGLRNFRNYIHPYEQMVSGFTPDEHTAQICWQVLKAALASVAGDRR